MGQQGNSSVADFCHQLLDLSSARDVTVFPVVTRFVIFVDFRRVPTQPSPRDHRLSPNPRVVNCDCDCPHGCGEARLCRSKPRSANRSLAQRLCIGTDGTLRGNITPTHGALSQARTDTHHSRANVLALAFANPQTGAFLARKSIRYWRNIVAV